MSRALSDGSAKEIEINNGKMLPKLIVPFLLEFSLLQIIKDRLNIGAKPLGRATRRKKDIILHKSGHGFETAQILQTKAKVIQRYFCSLKR